MNAHTSVGFRHRLTLSVVSISRDQLLLFFVAVNQLALSGETYLAHSISGTIRPYEWIPIVYGAFAGGTLLLAGVIALHDRYRGVLLAVPILLGSMVVGVVGTYLHVVRAILPNSPAGQRVSLMLIEGGPPVLAPLMFVMLGVLGLAATWVERDPDSGVLVRRNGDVIIALPLGKTRMYMFVVSLASLVTVISSVLDHTGGGFENPWMWLPTGVGVFATVVAAVTASVKAPTPEDLWTYVAAMILMVVVGPLGSYFHISGDLGVNGTIVVERFIRGAPVVAPLLFSNTGLLGLIVLLGPRVPPRAVPSPT